MEQTQPPKPKFRDLWTHHCGFNNAMIPTIANLAGVSTDILDAMLASVPVARADAEKVLLILSQHIGNWLTFPTLDMPTIETVSNTSEVAALMANIEAEYQAAKQALSGLASGTARHTFITRKMENMQQEIEKLRATAGEEVAMQFLVNWQDQEVAKSTHT